MGGAADIPMALSQYHSFIPDNSWLASFLPSHQAGAYFTALGTMAALVVPAVLLVIWQPASAGSGIPEIISYLNGVKPAKLFAPWTGLAKMVGMVRDCGVAVAVAIVYLDRPHNDGWGCKRLRCGFAVGVDGGVAIYSLCICIIYIIQHITGRRTQL